MRNPVANPVLQKQLMEVNKEKLVTLQPLHQKGSQVKAGNVCVLSKSLSMLVQSHSKLTGHRPPATWRSAWHLHER